MFIKNTILGINMFAKTLLSVLALGVAIVGLLYFFNTGEYFIFVIGMALYFLAAISDSIFKKNE
jgi:hypothetical protein